MAKFDGESVITITHNGVTLTGKTRDIMAMGIPVGPTYKSESKGIVLISEMHTSHIVNAIGKKYDEWLQNTMKTTREKIASSPTDTDTRIYVRQFVNEITKGPVDPELMNLMLELNKRKI